MKAHRIGYEEERAEDLCKVYRAYLDACTYVCMEDVWQHLSEWPARRFYVSERRAYKVVQRLLHGGRPLRGMHEQKREMFLEIYFKAMELRGRYPARSLLSIVREVVNSPAPKFYLGASSIKKIVRERFKEGVKSEELRVKS